MADRAQQAERAAGCGAVRIWEGRVVKRRNTPFEDSERATQVIYRAAILWAAVGEPCLAAAFQ